MKIIRHGNTDLEVTNASFLPSIGFSAFAIGYLHQELPKFFDGRQHFSDFKADIPIAFSVIFLLVGLALLNRYSARFDTLQQKMTWKYASLFGIKVCVVPFTEIVNARLEADPNQFVNDHPSRGPMVRLVIATAEKPLPLALMYTTPWKSTIKACEAINDFLGRKSEETSVSPEAQLRVLIAQGRKIAAIKLVREQRGCSLAEAKDVVEAMCRER
jgi:hypothetical protein